MTDETMNALVTRLDALADKLGVSATHLWAVLVKQAAVEVWIAGIHAVLGLALLFACGLLLRWTCRRDSEGRTKWVQWFDENNFPLFFGVSCGAIFAGLAGLKGVFAVLDLVRYTLNPDYFALQQILALLK